MSEWISNLKAGDKVILNAGGLSKSQRIETVERITPSGLVKVNNTLFSKFGFERGNGYYRCSISEATPETLKRIEEAAIIKKALEKIRSLSTFTYDQAVAILKILEPPEDKEKEGL